MSRRTWTAVRSALCTSARMASLPDDSCRIFFAQLILVCDSYGCIDARPHKLLATVWPLYGKTIEETARCARELERAGLVVRRRDARDEWLEVPDWEEKQAELIRRRGKRTFGAGADESEPVKERSDVDAEHDDVAPEKSDTIPPKSGQVPERPGVALTSTISNLSAPLADTPAGASRSPRAREAPPDRPPALTDTAREQLDFHPSLKTPAVCAALVRWEDHLRDHGHAWRAGTWATNLAKWATWGPDRLVRAIEVTIGAGKLTPFEPRHGDAPPTPSAPKPDAAATRAAADRRAFERELERRWEQLHTVEREMPAFTGGTVRREVLERPYPGHPAAEAELRELGLLSGNPPVFTSRKESA